MRRTRTPSTRPTTAARILQRRMLEEGVRIASTTGGAYIHYLSQEVEDDFSVHDGNESDDESNNAANELGSDKAELEGSTESITGTYVDESREKTAKVNDGKHTSAGGQDDLNGQAYEKLDVSEGHAEDANGFLKNRHKDFCSAVLGGDVLCNRDG